MLRPNAGQHPTIAAVPTSALVGVNVAGFAVGPEMNVFLKSHAWVYPTLEAMHIVGIALLLGNLVALEIRVFGRAAALPVEALARLSLSLAMLGFTLATISGVVMFASQASELIANRAFIVKMALLTLAGCNAALFHSRQSLEKLDPTARAQMLLSTALWIGAVFSGRWIAYI